MAKPLVVELHGQPLNLSLEKVERSKLYGYVETEVLDEAGERCELATLTGGHSVVGKGSDRVHRHESDRRGRAEEQAAPAQEEDLLDFSLV